MPSDGTLTLTIDGFRIYAALGGIQVEGAYSPPLSDDELEKLTWYMETDLPSLFGPSLRRAERYAAGLPAIGDRLYEALAPTPATASLLERGLAQTPELTIVVVAEASALAVPWELASVRLGQERRPLAALCEVVRAPLSAHPRPSVRPSAPRDYPWRVLIVSPRPRGRYDVPLQATQGPTLGAALSFRDHMSLDVVRPPTLEALASYAAAAPYDLIHFDGHGVPDENGAIALLFESTSHRSNLVSGLRFAEAVEHAQPRLILLNACRSSFVDPRSQSSLAGAIAAHIPDAVVIAMRYAVDPALVSALLTTFYPTLIETGDVRVALGEVRRALVGEFIGAAPLSKPHFITPTTFRACTHTVAATRPVRAERSTRGTKRTSPSAESVVDWAEMLWELDRALAHPDANVLLTGIIGSGKSTLARTYADYAILTGAFSRVEFIGDADARTLSRRDGQDFGHARAPERLLRIADYDGPIPPARMRRDGLSEANGELPRARLTCGRSWTDDESYSDHVELVHTPVEVLRTALTRLGGPGVAAWSAPDDRRLATTLIRLGQQHLGGLEALIRLAEDDSLASALWRMEWGAVDLPATPAVERIASVLSRLDERELATLAVLGLYEGPVQPDQLAILTDGGLGGDPFFAIVGRNITAAEWHSTLIDGVQLGLFDAVNVSIPLVRVVPLVGAVLRSLLRSLAGGEDALARLQSAMAWATAGEVRIWQQTPTLWEAPDETEWYRRETQLGMLVLREQNLSRALATAIRDGDDNVAVAIADAYFEAGAGSELFAQGLLVTSFAAEEHPDAYRDCLALRATVTTASMLDASWRGEWESCVSIADAAMELELASRAPPSRIVLILTTKAQSLSLLSRAEDAERALGEAFARASDDGERQAVDEAAQEVAHDLMLNEQLTRALRSRVGLPAEPARSSSNTVAARDAEARGDHAASAKLLLQELRSAEAKRDAIGAASLRDELGRLAALTGDPQEARFWLESALTLRSTLGLKTARTLYFLGVAAEAAGDFDDAMEWLEQSIAQSPPGSSLSADCVYELGLVALRRDELGRARELLERALDDYQRLGFGRYVADTWFMLGQLEALDSNEDRAVEYFERILQSDEASPQTVRAARDKLAEGS